MIRLYSGTPGSGKSLHVAERIYNRLNAGKPVVCNFAINEKWLAKKPKRERNFTCIYNDELSVTQLVNLSQHYFKGRTVKEDSILLIIDEAQLLFNARTWDAKGREAWLKFFTQHRKFGYEIILVAQFDRMLDRQIRSLIEYECVHRKLLNYGWKGILLSCLMLSPRLFVAVNVWYPMKEKTGAEFFKYKKRYSKLYDTHYIFG